MIQRIWWRLKAGVKELLLRSLYWSGASFIYSGLFGRRKTIILCYHTASDSKIHAYPNSVIGKATFRRQMHYLQTQGTVVPLAECIRRLRQSEPPPSRSVALTFDDGYKSCLDIVAPILREYGFPATFFVVPGFIDGGEGKWDDVLYFTMRPFRKAVLRGRKEEISEVMADLERSGGDEVRSSKEASARALLTWDEVKALRSLGHSVGSHSVHHYCLGAQQRFVQEQEIAGSKDRLGEVLREDVVFLAYPFGWIGSYTDETKALAKQAGYQAALTCEQGYLEDSVDLFAVKRMGISADLPFWKFKLMLSGLYF